MAKKKTKLEKAFHELKADNQKSGKERGVNGKPRSRKQMIAIALTKTGKSKKKK